MKLLELETKLGEYSIVNIPPSILRYTRYSNTFSTRTENKTKASDVTSRHNVRNLTTDLAGNFGE